jgi:hypothetical protein
MNWPDLIVPEIGVALEVVLITFLVRWGTWHRFPIYMAYAVSAVIQSIFLAGTFSHPQTYFYVFWISTPVEILLTILAVLESFWRVFRSFRLSRSFRFVLPLAIATALGYSAWQGYGFPPVEASPAGAAIINAALTSHYVILAVALLFFLLLVLLPVSWPLHESRFILGFAVASLAVILGGTIRAIFGSRFGFFSREAQPIGYLVALLIWLSAVVHPVPEPPMSAAPSEGQLEQLKIQLRYLSSFVRKGRR